MKRLTNEWKSIRLFSSIKQSVKHVMLESAIIEYRMYEDSMNVAIKQIHVSDSMMISMRKDNEDMVKL